MPSQKCKGQYKLSIAKISGIAKIAEIAKIVAGYFEGTVEKVALLSSHGLRTKPQPGIVQPRQGRMNRAGLLGLPSPKANEARPGGAQRALKGKYRESRNFDQSPAVEAAKNSLSDWL